MITKTDLKVDGVLYRLQLRKCGKAGCRCNNPSQGHGPYWYAYDGYSAAKYIGKNLPEQIAARAALIKNNAAKLKAIKVKIIKRRDDAYKAYLKAGEELRTVQLLEAGEHTDSKILVSLGLANFNGHGSG
jgi:hypothetical protein